MMNENQNSRHQGSTSTDVDPVPFPDEIIHLEMISGRLDAAIAEATATVERLDKEYMDAKRYMSEHRGEIDPHEMFQNERSLGQIDSTGAFSVQIWERLKKLEDSPYFARIDFRETEENEAMKYYIGRFAFGDENELLICDWRAPVASMFYDCEVGAAGYEAPVGRIEGDMTRKRQFKVSKGRMEFAIESSMNIQDNVLQRELSHTSDEKMKSIISTIQKEQNQIIRDEKAGTMIIQGVAGSGKTSIALHRVAYLLYRFKDKLFSKNVTILSPNKVFGDYISTVLPELGEEPISGLSFRDIANVQLEGVSDFEADKDPLTIDDEKWAERVRFKSTMAFVKEMDAYLAELPEQVFEATDYYFEPFTVTAEWIQARYQAYQRYPVMKRLPEMADDIYEKIESENYRGYPLPRKNNILKHLRKMLKVKNSFTLYKQFYQKIGHPEMLVMPRKETLEWADVYPFMYLFGTFQGLQVSHRIQHLVIDEMQDYTPIQYAVINKIFPCTKTILGDFGQFVNPNHLNTLSDMQELFPQGTLVELKKSYRSSYEIIMLAKGIQQIIGLEPMERHGDMPQLIGCWDEDEQIAKIKEKVEVFLREGEGSLGIILKTVGAAKEMHRILSEDYKIGLISPQSIRFTGGVLVSSIQMSKGLEFDEVIIPDVGAKTYRTSYDKSLLYIAVTRAMHKLTLLYCGEYSPCLPSLEVMEVVQ